MTIAARALIAETGICRARPAEPTRCGRTEKTLQTAVDMQRTVVEILSGTVEIPHFAVEILSGTVETPHIAVEILSGTVEIPHTAVEILSGTVEIPHIAVENSTAQAPGWAQSMTMCPGRSAWTRRRLPVKKRLPHPADRRAIRLLTRKCTQIPR